MKNDTIFTTSTTGKDEHISASRAEYEALLTAQKENAELNQKLDYLMGQLRLMKKEVFGASFEQATKELVGQLSLLFNAAEAWSLREEKPGEGATHGVCAYPAEAFQRSG